MASPLQLPLQITAAIQSPFSSLNTARSSSTTTSGAQSTATNPNKNSSLVDLKSPHMRARWRNLALREIQSVLFSCRLASHSRLRLRLTRGNSCVWTGTRMKFTATSTRSKPNSSMSSSLSATRSQTQASSARAMRRLSTSCATSGSQSCITRSALTSSSTARSPSCSRANSIGWPSAHRSR